MDIASTASLISALKENRELRKELQQEMAYGLHTALDLLTATVEQLSADIQKIKARDALMLIETKPSTRKRRVGNG